jgi:hypothetical protein
MGQPIKHQIRDHQASMKNVTAAVYNVSRTKQYVYLYMFGLKKSTSYKKIFHLCSKSFCVVQITAIPTQHYMQFRQTQDCSSNLIQVPNISVLNTHVVTGMLSLSLTHTHHQKGSLTTEPVHTESMQVNISTLQLF